MTTTTTTSANRKTPGVYVTEFSAFPPSVVGVQTAVPIFIGYTQYAVQSGKPAYGAPVEITSMADYAQAFGGAPPAGSGFALAQQLALFYQNGGGQCYVVSAGSYWTGQTPIAAVTPIPSTWTLATMSAAELLAGLTAAGETSGPTMTVIPEACQFDQAEYAEIACAMVLQAATLGDRVAILDLPGCLSANDLASLQACQANFWTAVAPRAPNASFAAAYAPALVLADGSTVAPSGAMAGIWAYNDQNRGVWTAPANLSVAGVTGPTYAMTDIEQGGFNVPLNGVAINVLRAFPGRGTVVWGARTLDGNSLDYRYIQVRRTLVYIQQSIKQALTQFALAPNGATTWAAATTMVSNFLQNLWSQGGLMGATASQAYTVACGVPASMTAQDVLNGYMIVNVTVQMIHPAEFIELTFTQTMQGD